MKKNLIICPVCEQRGKRNVLGEIDEEGNFVVLRFRKGLTKIKGAAFSVTCPECHAIVYYRRKNEK